MTKKETFYYLFKKNFSDLVTLLSRFLHADGVIDIAFLCLGLLFYWIINREKTIERRTFLFLLKNMLATSLIFYIISNVLQPMLVLRYFSIILPTLFLINVYFVKSLYERRGSARSWLMVFFFVPLIINFIFPIFLSVIFPDKSSGIMDSKLDIKHFIKDIKLEEMGAGVVLCILEDDWNVIGNEKSSIVSMYSIMYHEKNICSKTIVMKELENNKNREYTYILYYGKKSLPVSMINKYKMIKEISSADKHEGYAYLLKSIRRK